MRAEVKELWEKAKTQVDNRIPYIEEISARGEQLDSESERESFLEKMLGFMELISKAECGKGKFSEITVCTPSSFDIVWDEAPHKHNITIEMAMYVPLVAVYVYGVPPIGLLECLDDCIDNARLIKLRDDEIKEVEQSSYYHWVF